MYHIVSAISAERGAATPALLIQTIVVLTELTLLCFAGGYLVSTKIFKKHCGFFVCVSEGFVWMLGFFFLLALPFLWFELPFHTLFFTWCILSLFLLLTGGFVLLQQGRKHKVSVNRDIVVLLTLFLIVAQMLCSTYLYHGDDDDGYYITISNMAVEQDTIQTDSVLVYDGAFRKEAGTGFAPPIVSWELFIACIAKLNGVHPSILAHSILPLWLIAAAYLSVWRTACLLFEEKNQSKNSILFVLFYALLNLFGGFLVRQPACFLLLRIWQGKAVLVNVIFPLLIENCLHIYKRHGQAYWVRGSVLLFAGMMLSAVGLTITPMCYVSYGLPYLLYLLRKDRDMFRKCLLSAVWSILPTVFFCILSYWYVMSSKSGLAYGGKQPEPWMFCFANTMGTAGNGYLLLGICSFVVLLCMGGKAEKMCLAGGTGIAGGVFMNPLLSNFIGQKVTGVDVYWRVWWIVPVYAVIALACVYLLDRLARRLIRTAAVLAAAGMIAWSGQFMYQENLYFQGFQNAYMLPDEVIQICNYILEKDTDVSILVPQEMIAKIRQYSSKLYVPLARKLPGSEIAVPGSKLTYGQLYGAVYEQRIISRDVYKALKMVGVKYIVSKDLIVGGGRMECKYKEMYVWKMD